MDPVWIKKWVTPDAFATLGPGSTSALSGTLPADISCSGTDQLTRTELNILRLLQSPEAQDYAAGFYYNEYFESISVNYTCEMCDREMFDLGSLRRHMLARHSDVKAKTNIVNYSSVSFPAPPVKPNIVPPNSGMQNQNLPRAAYTAAVMANPPAGGCANPIEL